MPLFSYKATTIDGNIVQGAIEVIDRQSALEKLRNTGVIPLSITLEKERIKSRGPFTIRSSKRDLLTFTSEMSVLLGAGLPLDRSLTILAGISSNKKMKEIIQSIIKSIREGNHFSASLQHYPELFPRFYINMIRAGEVGGILNLSLEKLHEFLESTEELKSSIFSAMIYPTILVVTGITSIIIILAFVIPRFIVIFSEMGKSLPFSTQMLLGLSNLLQSYWWAFLAVMLSGWTIGKKYINSNKGGYAWDALKLKLLGDIITKLETARFCRTLGTLLRSGVSLLPALNNAKDVINNRVISSKMDIISKGAREGKGISVPLEETHIFPSLAMSMIKTGEETGQLDTMLIKTAVVYEKNLKEAVKRFSGILEPLLILVMGFIIGFIVISMLTAIFSITEIPF